jgi:hypothetical protein
MVCSVARNCIGKASVCHVSPLSCERNISALVAPAMTVFEELGSVCTIACGPPNGPNAFH